MSAVLGTYVTAGGEVHRRAGHSSPWGGTVVPAGRGLSAPVVAGTSGRVMGGDGTGAGDGGQGPGGCPKAGAPEARLSPITGMTSTISTVQASSLYQLVMPAGRFIPMPGAEPSSASRQDRPHGFPRAWSWLTPKSPQAGTFEQSSPQAGNNGPRGRGLSGDSHRGR